MKREPVLEALRRSARSGDLRGPRVLVGASGGVDSTVLACALAEIADELGIEVALGHVHHGLRDDDADGDEAAVWGLAERLGTRFVSARVAPATLREGRSSRERPTLQEAARVVRRDALGRLAVEVDAQQIALAHHEDDQAETVLLRLLRGCGPDALTGMAPVSDGGRWVRPLLRLARSEIEGFALRRGISWREDVSNRDPAYARNRLRHRWLPGLAEEFNPRLLRAIAELAEAQRTDRDWIASQVVAEVERRFEWSDEQLWIDRAGWDDLPEALSRRVARHALEEMGVGREVTRAHLRRFCAFVAEGRTGAELELPRGVRLAVSGEGARLRRVERGTSC